MGAVGNQFWKARAKHGRDKLFETPELLWEAACEYFQWCDENPLPEEKAFAYQGAIYKDTISKLRAYTMGGLCLFLDCTEDYFRSFKSQDRVNKNDFITVINKIESIVYNQKFTGAAADLLNANIISRELGLADKQEIKSEVNQVTIFRLPDNGR
jgi:hypothetical protein